MVIKDKEIKKVMNSSTYGYLQALINDTVDKMLKSYYEWLKIFNRYYKKGFVIHKVIVYYNCFGRFIDIQFIDNNKTYQISTTINTRYDYIVINYVLRNLKLLDKVEVISNVRKSRK